MRSFCIGQAVRVRGKPGTYRVLACDRLREQDVYTLNAFEGFFIRGDRLEAAEPDGSLPEVDTEAVWGQMLRWLNKRIDQRSYATWFGRCRPGRITRETCQILVPDETAQYWLTERYTGYVNAAYASVIGHEPESLTVEVEEEHDD